MPFPLDWRFLGKPSMVEEKAPAQFLAKHRLFPPIASKHNARASFSRTDYSMGLESDLTEKKRYAMTI
jgi:hypothetical protein